MAIEGFSNPEGIASLSILMRPRRPTRATVIALALFATTTSTEDVAHADGRARGQTHQDRAEPSRAPRAQSSPAYSPGTGSAYTNALRIARMLHDERLVARLLMMHGSGKAATEADLVAVIDANELAGTPELAIAFLRSRIQRYPDERRPRVLLAQLLARSGQSREAVATWQQQIARFGFESLSTSEVLRYARDSSRVGDVDGAYATLTRFRAKAPDDATDYWVDLATLAWERDDADAALTAYEHAYRLDPKTPHVGPRLMTLLASANRRDDAVRVAMAEHNRTGGVGPVLFAARLLANDSDWVALRALLLEAERSPGALYEEAEYFSMKGDAARHLGDLEQASKAYAAALALAPDDPGVRASALWTSIERGDHRQTSGFVERFRAGTRDQPELWLPMAHGLASIGRPDEALVWFSRQLRTNPRDVRLLLDASDAFSVVGRETLADELRARAVANLPTELTAAVRSKQRSDDDRRFIEATALALRAREGIPRADAWMSELFKSSPGRSSRNDAARPRVVGGTDRNDELAADWYLATERPELARRIVARSAPEALRKQRFALAVVDGDPTQLRTMLADASFVSENRAHALVALERDREAISVLGQELSRAPNGPDAPVMSEELARLRLVHQPNVRVGATYEHITGLDVVGPTVAASHDGLGGRLAYSASGSRMTDGGGQLLLRRPRDEAEAQVSLRFSSLRNATDLAAAFDYQPDAPVARASIFHQHRFTRQIEITAQARAGGRIYDTSFLRVAAVRNAVSVGLRYDHTHWYASAELDGREEQTRSYDHLAWDAIASAETGIKFRAREAHLAVGVQAQASRREYPTRLPGDVGKLVSPNVALVGALPPSFQLVGGVVHLSRGDPTERSRPERVPFPRYDCEAALGALLPDTDVALHVLCGASVRVPGGYTTLLAFYNRGVAGVKNNENAELALSYTLPF